MIPYDMLVFLSFCLLVGMLAFLILSASLRSKRDRERLQARAELEAKLIDHITSVEGFEQYLSAGGLAKLDASSALPLSFGHMRVIFLLAAGCGVTFLGTVLLVLFALVGLLVHNTALILAVMILAVGLALMLMAFVIYRVSLAWGLLKREPTGER